MWLLELLYATENILSPKMLKRLRRWEKRTENILAIQNLYFGPGRNYISSVHLTVNVRGVEGCLGEKYCFVRKKIEILNIITDHTNNLLTRLLQSSICNCVIISFLTFHIHYSKTVKKKVKNNMLEERKSKSSFIIRGHWGGGGGQNEECYSAVYWDF